MKYEQEDCEELEQQTEVCYFGEDFYNEVNKRLREEEEAKRQNIINEIDNVALQVVHTFIVVGAIVFVTIAIIASIPF